MPKVETFDQKRPSFKYSEFIFRLSETPKGEPCPSNIENVRDKLFPVWENFQRLDAYYLRQYFNGRARTPCLPDYAKNYNTADLQFCSHSYFDQQNITLDELKAFSTQALANREAELLAAAEQFAMITNPGANQKVTFPFQGYESVFSIMLWLKTQPYPKPPKNFHKASIAKIFAAFKENDPVCYTFNYYLALVKLKDLLNLGPTLAAEIGALKKMKEIGTDTLEPEPVSVKTKATTKEQSDQQEPMVSIPMAPLTLAEVLNKLRNSLMMVERQVREVLNPLNLVQSVPVTDGNDQKDLAHLNEVELDRAFLKTSLIVWLTEDSDSVIKEIFALLDNISGSIGDDSEETKFRVDVNSYSQLLAQLLSAMNTQARREPFVFYRKFGLIEVSDLDMFLYFYDRVCTSMVKANWMVSHLTWSNVERANISSPNDKVSAIETVRGPSQAAPSADSAFQQQMNPLPTERVQELLNRYPHDFSGLVPANAHLYDFVDVFRCHQVYIKYVFSNTPAASAVKTVRDLRLAQSPNLITFVNN